MKSIRALSAFVLFLVWANLGAQNIYKGYIFDSVSQKPIENAEIIVDSTFSTSSDASGFFTFFSKRNIVSVEVRHLSYTPARMKMAKNSVNTIHLSPSAINLAEFALTIKKPEEVMPGKKYQILDYEFDNNHILMLALENQSIFTPVLLLANLDGDTLFRLKVSNPTGLCKNYNGDVYYLTKKAALKICTDNNRIQLRDPMTIDEFNLENQAIVSKDEERYYLKSYAYKNQQVNYFSYNENEDKLDLFRSVCNDEVLANEKFGPYFKGKEEDLRFQELIILRPIFAPLVKCHDTLLIFNFVDSKLEKYSKETEMLSKTSIDFQKSKALVNEIYIDNISQQIYFLFRKNGISQLKEISKTDGHIIKTVKIPDFVYVENIKINNGIVYFLYKEKTNQEFKKLFAYHI
jgi:hypothetical protein